MADDPDSDDVVTVTQDGVTVEKRFTVDEFPVPAVEFVLRSGADEPVDVRLVDDIPESFDMEGVGFHPEYDGENWTAYRDHRVEYERTMEPGEEVTTVYGVRVDDPGSGERFLGEPRLESLSPDEDRAAPEDVLGRETTQAVRDALAGDGDLAASADDGVESVEADAADEEPAATTPADGDEPSGSGEISLGDPGPEADPDGDDAGDEEAVELDLGDPAVESEDGDEEDVELDLGDPEAASTEGDEDDVELDLGGPEAEPEGGDEEDVELDLDEPADDAGSDEGAEPDAGDAVAPRSVDDDLSPAVEPSEGVDGPAPATAGDDGAQDGDEGEPAAVDAAGSTVSSGAMPGSVVAALAAEIREGTVDDDDLDVLRDALDPGVPRSVEVRIDRLQNRTEDLAAYADALEEFIDEEGTGREVLDGLEAETTALREDLDAVEAEVDEAADDRDDLAAAVGAHDERLSDVESDLVDLEDRVAALDDGLDETRATVADLEADVEALAGDTDDDIGDLRDALDDVEATLADLEDEIEDFEAFRDRMRDAFGS